MSYIVSALYKFVSLPDFRELRAPLLAECRRLEICGTLLLAQEGINGTIAGSQDGIRALLGFLKADPRLAGLEHKDSTATEKPFKRMKVKLKKEIVTLGVPGIDPNRIVGTYVQPKDWNAVITRPDIVVLDTRNDYEVALGRFEGTLDPKIRTFRDFPAFVEASGALANKPAIAMFCTGGIRCEKASAYMLSQGFAEVYHLKGGILKYLEEVPQEESLWHGSCFVFDERVALGHGLRENPPEGGEQQSGSSSALFLS